MKISIPSSKVAGNGPIEFVINSVLDKFLDVSV